MKIISVLFILILLANPLSAGDREKQVVGLLEKVVICPENLFMTAKLDTGAEHSSLSATNIEAFERDGVRWVRFDVLTNQGVWKTREKKLLRIAKIKSHLEDDLERPVVRLGVCLGKHYREVDFNLADRRKFEHQLLIGRSFMSGILIVDPSAEFTTSPDCSASCGN
ncbi:MAG: RimK/LysX family protein [Thermodesulfobacteriota bacterium]